MEELKFNTCNTPVTFHVISFAYNESLCRPQQIRHLIAKSGNVDDVKPFKITIEDCVKD